MAVPNPHFQLYLQELAVYFLYSLCSVYFVFGLLYNYFLYSIYTERQWVYNPVKHVLDYGMVFFVIINIVAILANLHINWRYRNFRIKSSTENPMVVYMVCMPLLTLSFVALVFITVRNIILLHCHKSSEVIFGLSFLVVFIAIIILLIDTSGINATNEKWILNLSNSISVSLSLISIVTICIYNIIYLHISAIGKVNFETFHRHPRDNCSSHFFRNYSIEKRVLNAIQSYMPYYQCSIILLTVTLTPYFMVPLKRSIGLLRSTSKYRNNDLPDETNEATGGTLYEIVFLVLIIGVDLSIKVISYYQKGPYQRTLNVLEFFEYALMSCLTIYILTDVRLWTTASHNSHYELFSYAVLWAGMFGELAGCLNPILGIVAHKHKHREVSHIVIRVLKNLMALVQLVLQATLMSLVLARRFRKCRINGSRRTFKILNPITTLVAMNILFGIINVMNSNWDQPYREDMWYNVYFIGTKAMFHPLSCLYRGFCAVVLLKKMILTR